MRPAAIAFATAGFLASTAVAALVANLAVATLEDTTKRNSISALVASGQHWAHIETNGMQVILTGTAPDERKRIQAFETISGIVSISRIQNLMEVEESVPAIVPDFALEILRSGTDVSLIGLTPAEIDGDIIRSAIAGIAGVSLIDMKESTIWDAPKGWNDALKFGAEIMARVERAKISITPGKIVVAAVVKNDAEKQQLLRELLSIKPEQVILSVDITAPRPIFAPYILTFDYSKTETLLMCYALTPEGKSRIVSAAIRLGAPDSTKCEIGLGAPTDNWAEVAVAGMDAVANMGGGSLEMQDSGITLTAPVDFDAQTFNAIAQSLLGAIPKSYSLLTVLPETEVITDNDTRPYFHARLNADGKVLLEGVTIDEISKRTLLTYAEAKFGYETVNDISKIADFAPLGWTSRQLVALEVLSLLTKGNINVTEESVTVTGTGQTAGLYDAILSKLEIGFGADARFTIVVEENIPEPIVEDTPDAKECETEISALLDKGQILFAPSSAVIESTSVKTINKIVTILNRCKHAAFEIGGHTDSQGREEMNLNLSQNRADAVLDSLLARNMLLGDITAVGYGETQPIVDNETEEGRQENRRIAFKLLEETADGQN